MEKGVDGCSCGGRMVDVGVGVDNGGGTTANELTTGCVFAKLGWASWVA